MQRQWIMYLAKEFCCCCWFYVLLESAVTFYIFTTYWCPPSFVAFRSIDGFRLSLGLLIMDASANFFLESTTKSCLAAAYELLKAVGKVGGVFRNCFCYCIWKSSNNHKLILCWVWYCLFFESIFVHPPKLGCMLRVITCQTSGQN